MAFRCSAVDHEAFDVTAAVAELLKRLQGCDADDLEALCNVLAERVQQLSPGEVPQLFEALLAALHNRRGVGLRHSDLAVLDELCGSWRHIRLVPQNGLKTLLKLMLQGDKSAGHCQLRHAKSSPDLLRKMHGGQQQRIRGGDPDAPPVNPHDGEGLPPGDARLLQVLLRLVGLRDDGAGDRRDAPPRPAECDAKAGVTLGSRRRGRSFGSSSCSAAAQGGDVRGLRALASPTVTSGTAAPSIAAFSEELSSWASRAPSLEGEPTDGRRYVFDMAEDDSSHGSRGSSRTAASLDWCFDALDIASSTAGGSSTTQDRCLVLTPRSTATSACQRFRGKSLPAELRVAAAAGLGEDMCQQEYLRGLRERMQAESAMSQQFHQLRNNQIVCLQAAQETAALVVDMNRAVEAERAARLAEIQERTALRAELRTVCAQVEALARGQQELQQCMMMMCAQMAQQFGAQQPPQQRPPTPQPQPRRHLLLQSGEAVASTPGEGPEEYDTDLESSRQCPTPGGRRTVSVHRMGMQQMPQAHRRKSPPPPMMRDGPLAGECTPQPRRTINVHNSARSGRSPAVSDAGSVCSSACGGIRRPVAHRRPDTAVTPQPAGAAVAAAAPRGVAVTPQPMGAPTAAPRGFI